MTGQQSDVLFTGSIPELYERFLVPLIFEPYGDDLAERVDGLGPRTVLEVAAGTGVVTRALSSRLPSATAITATDLNQPMVDFASGLGTARPVTWRQADALDLPFEDGAFDAVVCQFGVMFFPDRGRAFNEFRRVLCPDGALVFNVWDRIELNEFADVVTEAMTTVFPDDPPMFLARTPHGHHDRERLSDEVVAAGFDVPTIDTIESRSRAASADDAAIGYCQGTPLRNEIEARDPSRLAEATTVAAAAIADRFGRTDIDGKIQAHVFMARRP